MRQIKKILFIVPPLLTEKVEFYPDFPTPPLGVGYICANTLIDVEKDILDFSLVENWEDVCVQIDRLSDYDVYAFTSMTSNFFNALKVCQRLRSLKNGIFIIGGNHVTVAPSEVLNTDVFDIGIMGEGEKTFNELIFSLNQGKALENIPGIVFKGPRGEIIKTGKREYIKNLDALHFPDRQLIPMQDYLKCFNSIIPEEIGTTLLCSRGCPFSCAFCSKEIFGNLQRHRSPENIVEEICHLIREYQVNMIHFVDDNFTTNHRFIERLCKLLIKQKMSIQWQCESRVDTINKMQLKQMKRAGCKRIFYGIESGSLRILEKMKKNIRLEDVIRVFIMTKEEKIDTGAFIMLGYPGETKGSLEETIRVVEQVRPEYISVSFATILPGTKLHQEYKTTSNWNSENFNDYHIGSNIYLDGIDFHDLLEAREEIFKLIRK